MCHRWRNEPYPVFLNLDEKSCVVFGGGKVAERKITSLLKAGARVSCFSEVLTPFLQSLVQQGKIRFRSTHFNPGQSIRPFLRKVSLVIAATSSGPLNAAVSRECKKRNILVNVVDVPRLSNFISPAVFSRGALRVAVSTGGRSPELAKSIRKRLEGFLGREYGDFLDFMSEKRGQILSAISSPAKRKKLFRLMVSSRLLTYFKEKNRKGAERYYARLLEREKIAASRPKRSGRTM